MQFFNVCCIVNLEEHTVDQQKLKKRIWLGLITFVKTCSEHDVVLHVQVVYINRNSFNHKYLQFFSEFSLQFILKGVGMVSFHMCPKLNF